MDESIFTIVGRGVVQGVSGLGEYLVFFGTSLKRCVFPRVSWDLLVQQMEFVGVRSVGVIILSAIMVGAVFGIQFGVIFRTFGVESLIGAAAAYGLSKELSPVLTAFLVTGRAGSAMTAEIASMKVNEQIDALRVMSVNPISYLASPRVLASMIMLPLLAGLFTLVGVCSAYVIGVQLFEVDVGVFFSKIEWITKPKDVVDGLVKAFLFGGIYSSIACYKGFRAMGGAKGVGRFTTEAVVSSLVTVLVLDFFISYFQMRRIF